MPSTANNSRSSSPNNNPDDDRPTKRRRTRTGIACDSCQRRKTRCELLNGDQSGCHRCHVLGTECSLVPDAGGSNATPGPAPADYGRDSERWRLLDERTERIESALNRVLAKGSGAGSADGVVELKNIIRDTPQRDGGIGIMTLKAFRQGMTSRWMDPVKAGLVSEKQLEQCVQQYIDQTALILPVDSIKSLVTTHTNHPLVRTAILIYTMPHLRPKLHKVLQANLGVADSAPPSMAAFMGYLILAHIPQVKEELVTSIDVSCAAIRGMGQAMALGLDDTVHAVTQPGFDWTIEMESIERLSALYTMSHRVAWTHLFSTPGFTHQSTLPLLINVIPISTAISLQSRLLLHLTLESILLLLLDPVVQALRRSRLERTFNEGNITIIQSEFTTFQEKVARWREDVEFNNLSSSNYLIFHSHLVEALLAFTLSGIHIPTPILLPNRMEIVMFFGGSLLEASLRLIDHVLATHFDLALVPSFHLVLALFPLASLIQSGKLAPETDDVTSRHDRLVAYKSVLSRAHPKVSLIIHDIDNMEPPHDYSHYGRQDDFESGQVGGLAPGWDLGFDQLFDMDALWPLMGEWANTSI